MTQVILLSYAVESIPEIPRTVEDYPTLTQRGTKGQLARAAKVNHEAKAGRSTVVAAKTHPEITNKPTDLQTMLSDAAQSLQITAG